MRAQQKELFLTPHPIGQCAHCQPASNSPLQFVKKHHHPSVHLYRYPTLHQQVFLYRDNMSTPDTCSPVDISNGQVGLAFGIVTAAGLSTTVGAAAAFLMPYSSAKKNLFLAASLSIAAGVMLYVSFVEIFVTKALEEFEACADPRFVPFILSLFPLVALLLNVLLD